MRPKCAEWRPCLRPRPSLPTHPPTPRSRRRRPCRQPPPFSRARLSTRARSASPWRNALVLRALSARADPRDQPRPSNARGLRNFLPFPRRPAGACALSPTHPSELAFQHQCVLMWRLPRGRGGPSKRIQNRVSVRLWCDGAFRRTTRARNETPRRGSGGIEPHSNNEISPREIYF